MTIPSFWPHLCYNNTQLVRYGVPIHTVDQPWKKKTNLHIVEKRVSVRPRFVSTAIKPLLLHLFNINDEDDDKAVDHNDDHNDEDDAGEDRGRHLLYLVKVVESNCKSMH